MNINSSNMGWDITTSGYFNGIPCTVVEETHIILDKQGKSTSDFVDSPEFQMLKNAGIEVHSRAYS